MNNTEIINKINSYITYAKLQNIKTYQDNMYNHNLFIFKSSKLFIQILLSPNKNILEAKIQELNTYKSIKSKTSHDSFFNKLDHLFTKF